VASGMARIHGCSLAPASNQSPGLWLKAHRHGARRGSALYPVTVAVGPENGLPCEIGARVVLVAATIRHFACVVLVRTGA
jgi:hypothetical protein